MKQICFGSLAALLTLFFLGLVMFSILGGASLFLYPILTTIGPVYFSYKSAETRNYHLSFLVTNWIGLISAMIWVYSNWSFHL